MKDQRLTGYEVMMDSLGNVHQAAIPSDPVSRHYPIDVIERPFVECVVEATYYTDEDDRNAVTKSDQRTVMVDVRTLSHHSRQVRWIPVLQRTQGVWDEDIYIPRPARVNMDGGDMSTGSAAKGDTKATPAESMDGDRGLIIFLEMNPAKPAFLPYSQGHPKSPVRKAADGRVKRIRHAGVLMEWSEDGNWTLDATEAAKEELAADGSEQPNNGTGGIVTLKTKDGGGAELYLELDAAGNVKLQDGGGTEYLEFTKASKQAELAAATKVALTAGSALELIAGVAASLTAPTQTFTAGTSFALTSPAQIFTAGTAFTVVGPNLTLGTGVPTFLVKHTPWAALWASLTSILTSQEGTYRPGPSQPSTVSVSDYYNLVKDLLAVANAFPGLTTTATKAA